MIPRLSSMLLLSCEDYLLLFIKKFKATIFKKLVVSANLSSTMLQEISLRNLTKMSMDHDRLSNYYWCSQQSADGVLLPSLLASRTFLLRLH